MATNSMYAENAEVKRGGYKLKIANSRGKRPVINQIKRARTSLNDLLIEINPCKGKEALNEAISLLWKIMQDNIE